MKVGKNADAGINRVWWDLRGDPTEDVKLRTQPAVTPPSSRSVPMARASSRPAAPLSVLVPPGTYTVKLIAGGQERGRAAARRAKDPNTAGTEADIQAQTRYAVADPRQHEYGGAT